ncbi:31817_t:CDS:1, partial [Racocetra persica]
MDDIHCFYNLYSVKIPVRPTDGKGVFRFIEALLNLRNIIIINMSLLCHSANVRSQRLRKRSLNVFTPPPQ